MATGTTRFESYEQARDDFHEPECSGACSHAFDGRAITTEFRRSTPLAP